MKSQCRYFCVVLLENYLRTGQKVLENFWWCVAIFIFLYCTHKERKHEVKYGSSDENSELIKMTAEINVAPGTASSSGAKFDTHA
jgi:hypothetical protein